MKSIKIAGLCLVAVFAFSAVAAGSAFASEAEPVPTFKVCAKATKVGKSYTGKYNDKACTEANAEGKGKYELEEVAPGTKLSGTSKETKINAKSTAGATEAITCSKDTVAGEITGPNSFTDTVTYSKCVANGEKKTGACEDIVAAGGGELYWINAGETVAGAVTGAPAPFKCGTATVELKNSLISTVVNASKGFNVVAAVNGSGEQEDRAFWVGGEEIGGEYVHLSTEVGAKFYEATLAGTEEVKAKDISIR